ncbi:hypothetical protein OCUBac02_11200 [Bosea sp. ANAM02]|nr:hypothetical protein OCUBac02_11200 [Bosea sp. ANAM02]
MIRLNTSQGLHLRFALLAALLIPATAEAALRPCRDVSFSRPTVQEARQEALTPTPANGMGCVRGVSVAAGDGARLWRCAASFDDGVEIPENAPEHAFLLERTGRKLIEMPDSLMAGRLGSFDLITVDLDGDGTRERVLAAWNTQGNGIGINSWTIRVFASDWTLLKQFDEVLDWGDGHLVAAPQGRPGCDIAITGFVESRNRQGREGVSYEARFVALRAGRLVPADDRPTLQRRYDRTFERQRTALFERDENRNAPELKGDLQAWLSHRSTIRKKPDAP